MQKLTRSLAMAGALAFAGVLAGCGDDVTVSNPTTVTVTPPSASIPVGGSVTFTAQVTGDIANKTVTWSSSDAAKATVDANGKVTGVAVGNSTITATSAGDANAKASALVTVTAVNKGVTKVDVSPPNAIIKAGEFIQLTANVTRDPGVAGTVTWTSSATAVATVDATGKVTGVANGSAVITAASTVDPTVSGSMALTVRPIQKAQISIQKITFGNTLTPVNFNNVFGQIDVTLNVDPGDEIVTKAEVLIDGVSACSQNLSVSQSQQLSFAAVFADVQAVDIVCSINTAEFNATTGAVKYANGVRQLTAKATIGGTTPGNVATPSQALTFNNANGYAATTAFTGTTATATNTAGFVYKRGGVTVTIIPVVYSGGLAIATGTLTFGAAGCDAAGVGPRSIAVTAPAAGSNTWTATFPQTATGGAAVTNVQNYEFSAVACAAANAKGETITFTAVDNAGNTLFANMQPADSATRQGIRLDNRAPGAPTFMANPNNRQNGWINAGVGLTALNAGTAATVNNWLLNGTADAGVGGYNRFLRVGDGTSGTVSAAIAATSSATPALPPPTVANNSLCAVATATDALGNESALPTAATVCLAPPFASNTATASSNLRFGVDIAAPTIAFSGGLGADARVNTATVAAEFQVTVADTGAVGNSGMLSGSAVVGTVTLRNATATGAATCIVGVFASSVCGATSVNAAPGFPLVPTTVVAAQTAVGYYTYNALAQDAAGNQTASVTRVVVRDNTPATATSPAVPVTITGAFTASSFLNDDLSIRDYYYTVGFGGALTAPATITLAAAPTAVDAFNSATLTNTNFAINTAVNTFLGLQSTTAGNAPNAYVANAAPLNSLNLFVRDQAQAAYTAAAPAAIAPTAPATGVSITSFTTFAPATVNATVCAGTLPAGCAAVPTTTDLTAVATGTTAVFNNPFSRVDFYGSNGTDLVLLGSVPAASATLVDNGATRVWTYTLTQSGATLGAKLGTTVTRNIYAFGVNAAGNVALVTQALAQTINP